MSEQPTLTAALARYGYSHRPPRNKNHGGREIYSVATGEVFGVFPSSAAWDFLAERHPDFDHREGKQW